VATTTGACRIGRKGVAIDKANPEESGPRFRGMSNPELLLFGVTTKCRSFLEASPDQSPPEDVLVQLTEARKEWNRRNPSLPLRESF
jgi:hypothetical protein